MLYIIILLLAGVLLAFMETFIPSGGILSFLAGLSLIAAIVLGFMQSGTVGCIVLLLILICVPMFVLLGLRILPITPIGRKMLLIEPGQDIAQSRGKAGVSRENYSHLKGKTGIAISKLRPSGFAEIDGKRYSVLANCCLHCSSFFLSVTVRAEAVCLGPAPAPETLSGSHEEVRTRWQNQP